MRRAAIAAMLASMALNATVHAASGIALTDLMALLRRDAPSAARFNETKQMALLDRPLESSGELLFTPPARLEKRTTSPGSERLLVDGDRLVIERMGRTQTMSLSQLPQAATILEGIRATLAGDRATLTRLYNVGLEGGADAWRMSLVPRDAEVAKVVSRIVLAGVRGDVRRVEIEQADGDRSFMQITPGQ